MRRPEDDMARHKVQQFRASEDDFYELGGQQMLDLTDDELNMLHEGAGEPILLERHDGFFLLVEEG
jgi:hypothetical protein